VLPGFGPKSTQALAKIGIRSIEDLKGRDLYDVYRLLKESAPGTSLNFMYGPVKTGPRRRPVVRNTLYESNLVLAQGIPTHRFAPTPGAHPPLNMDCLTAVALCSLRASPCGGRAGPR